MPSRHTEFIAGKAHGDIMILTADYHTHTPYSHGKNTVIENTLVAKEKGLKEIAITDHGFNHLMFGLKRKALPSLRADVEEAKKATGLNVLMGMESNLISLDGDTDMRDDDLQYFDIYLCGIHEILKYRKLSDMYHIMWQNYWPYQMGKKPKQKIIDNTTKAYINAIKNHPIDILTHINYRCCCDVVEVAKCCADYGTYIEINTKPEHVARVEPEDFALMATTGVRFVIDSDAHTMDRVGDTAVAEKIIAESGLSLDLIDNIDGRRPKFRFEEYKNRHL